MDPEYDADVDRDVDVDSDSEYEDVVEEEADDVVVAPPPVHVPRASVSWYWLSCIEMMMRLSKVPSKVGPKRALTGLVASLVLGGVFTAGSQIGRYWEAAESKATCFVKLEQSPENIMGGSCASLFTEFTLRNRQFVAVMNMTPCDELSALEPVKAQTLLEWARFGIAASVYAQFVGGDSLGASAYNEDETRRAEPARIAHSRGKRDVFECRTKYAGHFAEVVTLDQCLTNIVCPGAICNRTLWDIRTPGYRDVVNSAAYKLAREYVPQVVSDVDCMRSIKDFLLTETGGTFLQELVWDQTTPRHTSLY